MALTKIRTLGSGGFGIVDLVEDDAGAHFARKTFYVLQNLPPQIIENVRRRFAREARTQMGIRHRNIVPVVGGDLDHDPPYYLMPVAVSSLQDDLARDGTLGGTVAVT
jgi:eukaryotic-like serine/threonine-protein kinase